MKINVNANHFNKNYRASAYNPPNQIMININPTHPQVLKPNPQYPNTAPFYPPCVDWVTQQSQFYLSHDQLQSNPVFLKMLVKRR